MRNKKCTSLLLTVLTASLAISPVYAATTQNKITDAQNEKQAAQNSLNAAQSNISALEAKKGNLEAYLTELNRQLSDLSQSLADLQVKSDTKQKELQQIETELTDAKAKKESQYESMKLRIQYMYEQFDGSYLTMLMEAKDFTDFLNKAENIMQITKYDREMLADYKEIQQDVEEKEASVKAEQEEIKALWQESSDKQAEISDIMKSTSGQIESYTAQISSEQSNAQNLIAKVSTQESNIDALIKQQKDEEAAAALAQKQTAAKNSSSQSNASNKTESPSSTTPSAPENVTPETPPQENNNSGNSSGTYLGNFRLTAYCNGSCCGGQGLTASGTVPAAGRTVAMGGIPFGTRLLINGQVYTVEDRGTPYGHVDIYHDTHAQALNFGSRYADVYQLN